MATVKCLLHEAAHIARERPAFLVEDTIIHYGELDLMVTGTATLLREAGIRAGEKVALYMENGWPAAALIFALIRLQAIACPLNTRLPVGAVREQLEHIGCRRLIARVTAQSQAALDTIECLDPDGLVSPSLSISDPSAISAISLDQPCTILFSSGQSGKPKAALHSYGNHYYSAYGANLNVRLRSEDCWLLSLPLYHVGGLGILFRCLQSGAAIAPLRRSDTLEKIVERQPVTHLSIVPTQLWRWLQSDIRPETIRRLRAVLVGGGPLPENLLQAAKEKGLPVLPTYGLTEMTAQVTTAVPGQPIGNDSGKLLRYRELKIAPDGEILVRGATLFQGYVEGDHRALPVNQDGWFATGDIGGWTAQDTLQVRGRKDRMLVSGGENIHPETIEAALLRIDGVQQAVVQACSDEEYGARPVAFVQRTPETTDAFLEKTLRTILPAHLCPTAFLPWPDSADLNGAIKPIRAHFNSQDR